MAEYRMRYRLQMTGRQRSGWVEWGLFLLAVIVAAGLLASFALTSPILAGPAPLPDGGQAASSSHSAGNVGGGGSLPEPPPPSVPQ
jgi:hypothetical protein